MALFAGVWVTSFFGGGGLTDTDLVIADTAVTVLVTALTPFPNLPLPFPLDALAAAFLALLAYIFLAYFFIL